VYKPGVVPPRDVAAYVAAYARDGWTVFTQTLQRLVTSIVLSTASRSISLFCGSVPARVGI